MTDRIRLLYFMLVLGPLCHGQAGSLDTTFNSADVGFAAGDGGFVHDLVIQPDGRIVVVSNAFNGAYGSGLKGLMSNGQLDTAFGSSFHGCSIAALAIQADGRVLAGGTGFPISHPCVQRFHPNGVPDTSFTAPYFFEGSRVTDVVVQPDGKVVAVGSFSWNGLTDGIARFLPNGIVDTTFLPGLGASGTVEVVALQPDGRILIGGSFSTYNGVPREQIARLESDGTLDPTFDPGGGPNGLSIGSIALQSDGRVLVGGDFDMYDGEPRDRIARLNTDGSLDSTFLPMNGTDSWVGPIVPQADGQILVGGDFTSFGGVPMNRLARLNPDGSVDTLFVTASGADGPVDVIALRPDGKVLVGGRYSGYQTTGARGLVLLDSSGTVDASFNVGSGANSWIESLVVRPDDKILIGGWFSAYDHTAMNKVALLNSNGSLDTSFQVGAGPNDMVYGLAIQPDERILVSGSFTQFDGRTRNGISRIHADGTLDSTFLPSLTGQVEITELVIQPDGRVIAGGSIPDHKHVVRFLADGQLDTTFIPGYDTSAFITGLALQPDGRILVSGILDTSGTYTVYRLFPDGSLDPSFDIGIGANWRINDIQLLADGKVLVGGAFSMFNEQPHNRMVRLLSDGTVDMGFELSPIIHGEVQTMFPRNDGSVLIGGDLWQYFYPNRNSLALISNTGDLAADFDPGMGADWTINTLGIDSNDRILIGGRFTSYDGIGRNRIARVFSDISAGLSEEAAFTSAMVWPNPANEVLYLASSEDVQVFDLQGRLVSTHARTAEVPVASLEAGLYLLRFADGRSVRFVKE